MAECFFVVGKPHLKRPHQCPRGVPDEMREAVVWHCLAPMTKDHLGVG